MKFLVIEDNNQKFDKVKSITDNIFINSSNTITRSSNIRDAVSNIYQKQFDIIIIDIMVPQCDGEAPVDASDDFISAIENSELNKNTDVIVLTQHSTIASEKNQVFSKYAIPVILFQENEELWKSAIERSLERIKSRVTFDFLIFCALRKERQAYKNTTAELHEIEHLRGVDSMPMEIDGVHGLCILQPSMGLVEAATTTAQALERYRPKIVAMSGICAGVGPEINLCDLVIPTLCWEYQAGKWHKDGFKIEPYSVSPPHQTLSIVTQLTEQQDINEKLLSGIPKMGLSPQIHLGPMATGSAVIADQTKMSEIAAQHRKMIALDMEMYSVFKACQRSSPAPQFFGVKTVVDTGDTNKSDTYHEFGCTLSARFTVAAISKLLATN